MYFSFCFLILLTAATLCKQVMLVCNSNSETWSLINFERQLFKKLSLLMWLILLQLVRYQDTITIILNEITGKIENEKKLVMETNWVFEKNNKAKRNLDKILVSRESVFFFFFLVFQFWKWKLLHVAFFFLLRTLNFHFW